MNPPVRWLHLSDFHVGKDNYAQRKIFDKIIEHVQDQKNIGIVPDFIFITGDLANRGIEAEYQDFWLEFILPLWETIGDEIERRTFVVPGNHDVDRTQSQAFDRNEMASPESRYFDPNPEGKNLRKMLFPRFKAFVENSLVDATQNFFHDDGAFNAIIKIKNIDVGIAGINTAWLSKDGEDEMKLTPGIYLLEKALASIGKCAFRVVLGHHPINWIAPKKQRQINSLLGSNSDVYLHGHLHESWAEPTYGAGTQFLSIQSGAAFQARENEIWKNGLVWGEFVHSPRSVQLQARVWNSHEQNWGLASDAFNEYHRNKDWWIYHLPHAIGPRSTSLGSDNWNAGPWHVVDIKELESCSAALPLDQAIKFFDGAVPDWRVALSLSIPRREIVSTLVEKFTNLLGTTRPVVTILLAAGCEGKTTALYQSAYEIKKNFGTNILQWFGFSADFESDQFLSAISNSNARWLVVIDEADRIAQSLCSFLNSHASKLGGRVHFLLASRDSDWRGSKASQLSWASISQFHQIDLKGFSLTEAELIVTAWDQYGEAGLGSLRTVSAEKRASVLLDRATEEAKNGHGAFFGALLATRHGDDLRQHCRLLLERLDHHQIPSGGTLRTAIVLIAAMHAENLDFLSRPVLAWLLGCPSNRLAKDVLIPLGQEAAATSTSRSIFTRHQRVAKAIIDVINDSFGEDIDACFLDLGASAIECAKAGEYVPDLEKWKSAFSDHFHSTGRRGLSLSIAKNSYARDLRDPILLATLANRYSQINEIDLAASLFYESPIRDSASWQFYAAWAHYELMRKEHYFAIRIGARSLDDTSITKGSPLTTDTTKALKIIKIAFEALFKEEFFVPFAEASESIAVFEKIIKGERWDLGVPALERALQRFQMALDEVNKRDFPSFQCEIFEKHSPSSFSIMGGQLKNKVSKFGARR